MTAAPTHRPQDLWYAVPGRLAAQAGHDPATEEGARSRQEHGSGAASQAVEELEERVYCAAQADGGKPAQQTHGESKGQECLPALAWGTEEVCEGAPAR